MKLSKKEISQFQKLIWDYYKKYGRSMPWRGEKDPYKVLVSEIMLQQTQVSRVLAKYKEFLRKFPNIGTLARAPLSEVLKKWQGLGYNRRAKFLHQFAKEVVSKHKGKIPQDYETLLTLPGIGKATVGSLSAFAFNKPVPFIETNIRRVYIHQFFADKKNVSDADILKLVEATLPISNSREWHYALMDYGVHLKSHPPAGGVNPNRKSKHYTKQSKFEGSNREVRGAILKKLSISNSQFSKKLEKDLGFSKKRFDTALAGLIKEGFVIKKGKYILLT